MPVSTTTIKVSTDLRDRLATDARGQGKSMSAFLVDLLDTWERRERLESVRRAYADLPRVDTYWSETAAWDITVADGLDDA